MSVKKLKTRVRQLGGEENPGLAAPHRLGWLQQADRIINELSAAQEIVKNLRTDCMGEDEEGPVKDAAAPKSLESKLSEIYDFAISLHGELGRLSQASNWQPPQKMAKGVSRA